MKRRSSVLYVLVAVFCLSSSYLAIAQATNGGSSSAMLRSTALQAIEGGRTISQVVLTGTVTYARRESIGPQQIQLSASSAGHVTIQRSFPNGTFIEDRDLSQETPVGNLAKQGGTTVALTNKDLFAYHPAWFFPALMLSSTRYDNSSRLVNIQKNDVVTKAFAIWRRFSKNPSAEIFGGLGPEMIYFDTNTSLPLVLEYSTPANLTKTPSNTPSTAPQTALKVPVEIRFSDYRVIQGVQIAFHMQVLRGGLPLEDIVLSEATIN